MLRRRPSSIVILHNRYMADSERIVQLDGLRAFAVAMVFLSHVLHSQLLWTGVDLFFVLSGFLITGILLRYRDKHTWGRYLSLFYARRARRILPPYLLLLGVTSVLFGFGWLRHWYLFMFFMNTTAFLDVANRYTLWSLWTLAVEEQFYFFWPFVVYWIDEVMLAWLAGAVVVAAPLARWVATAFFVHHWKIDSSTLFRMDLLAAGALIGIVWRRYRTAIERFGTYGLLLTGVAAVPLLLFSWQPWFQPAADTVLVNVWLYELSLIGYVGILLWALGGRFVGILKLKPVVYLGRISYSVYLIHATAITVMRQHFHHYSIRVSSALFVTLLYAGISWRWIEQPLLKGGKPIEPAPPTESALDSV